MIYMYHIGSVDQSRFHPHGKFPKGLESKRDLPPGWAKRFGGLHPSTDKRSLPPGLVKKDVLPPGWAKRFSEGLVPVAHLRKNHDLPSELKNHADYQSTQFLLLQNLYEACRGDHDPVSKVEALDYLKAIFDVADEAQVKTQFWATLMPLINPDLYLQRGLNSESKKHLGNLFRFANHYYNLATA